MRWEGERLSRTMPDLESALTSGALPPAMFEAEHVRRETVFITMRDGTRLATDIYLPPMTRAPSIVSRTPYGRHASSKTLTALAQHGYVVISQDCRGTGESEPDTWDYFIYEPDDSLDTIDWLTRQAWFDGFVAACGGSYIGSTQWCMAAHPRMSTIVPEVAGVGVTFRTARLYMFLNAYVRSVGKGPNKTRVHYGEMERRIWGETLSGGYFNDSLNHEAPLEAVRQLWEKCVSEPPAHRVELLKRMLSVQEFDYVAMVSLVTGIGRHVAYGAHSIPSRSPAELARRFCAPALIVSGWYDWNLRDTLATWELLKRQAHEPVRSRSRLLITPSAHNAPGYHEGTADHRELQRSYRTENIAGLLLRWYAAVRDGVVDSWPAVIYYLMGANEWRVAGDWPPLAVKSVPFYLGADRRLTTHAPQRRCPPDVFTYDPMDPTPTVGGSIISYVYPPGSCDVSEVQKRSDVLSYTTAPLSGDLDVVGPLRLVLYAASSAVDTDFAARLSDVFPDGRAIQLQSGILRARHRNPDGPPSLLEPGRTYRLEIDLWATANRFKAGHRLRLDISSADFPRFDRNTNRGGDPGPPVSAVQTIFHDPERPSHLLAPVLGEVTVPE